MKRAIIFAMALALSGCSSEMASAQVIHVKCQGIEHYTGLIGTTGQFTSSEFFDDWEYVFDLTKKEVDIVAGGIRSPFCDPSNECKVNFGERLITAVRGEDREGRIWTTAIAFDRESMEIRSTRSGPGSLRQSELVCTSIPPSVSR